MGTTLQDRIQGSLVGGAIGDALGYPVEFICSYEAIRAKYGENGITRLDTCQHGLSAEEPVGKAVFSDDTQMTLYTANGLLNAKRQHNDYIEGITRAYVEWYVRQAGKKTDKYKDCWISRIAALNKNRAPGNTCMSALEAIYRDKKPSNNSKGCGGVMRVAPIPLFAVADNRMGIQDADSLAADAAKITHLHPLGFIPAALMAHVIYRLAFDEHPTQDVLVGYIKEGIETLTALFPQYPNEVNQMRELACLSLQLAINEKSDEQNIPVLGEGWVGDEALAIALYCSVRYFDHFEQALIAAVNHVGDSDSTGSLTGNILGAAVGYNAIPQHFKDDLEQLDIILRMADDVYRGDITN